MSKHYFALTMFAFSMLFAADVMADRLIGKPVLGGRRQVVSASEYNETNLPLSEWFETTPPPPSLLIPASSLLCRVGSNSDGKGRLLLCNDIPLETIFFDETKDCENVAGYRQCSKTL